RRHQTGARTGHHPPLAKLPKSRRNPIPQHASRRRPAARLALSARPAGTLTVCQRPVYAYDCRTMLDTLKKTLLAGVGAAVVTKEKVETALNDFVAEGKVTAADARKMAAKIADDGKVEFEKASSDLNRKIKELLARNDKETQQRLDALE